MLAQVLKAAYAELDELVVIATRMIDTRNTDPLFVSMISEINCDRFDKAIALVAGDWEPSDP